MQTEAAKSEVSAHEPAQAAVEDLAPEEPKRGNVWVMAARFAAGIVLLLACVALIASQFRPELEGLGRGFVARFGFWGMALGAFIADGFHFPVPPQFYMLLAVAAGSSQIAAF